MAAERASRNALIKTSRNVVCTLLLLSAYASGQPQDATRASIHIQIQNRFLAPGSECVFAVELRGVPESTRSEGAGNLKLRFPGFSPLGKPSLDAEGKDPAEREDPWRGIFPF